MNGNISIPFLILIILAMIPLAWMGAQIIVTFFARFAIKGVLSIQKLIRKMK